MRAVSSLRQYLAARILLEPLAAVLLWGGVFTAAKRAMEEIPALSFTVERIWLGGLLLALAWTSAPTARLVRAFSSGVSEPRAAGPVPMAARVRAGSLWLLLIPAALAQVAFQALFMQSIHLTTAGLSAILLATSPLLTASWLALRGLQRLTSLQWMGLLVGFGGVAVVMASAIGDVSGTLLGNVLALAAGAAWAWYGVAIAPPARLLGPVRSASLSLLLAGLVLTPFMLPQFVAFRWESVSLIAWAGLAYAAVLGLAVPTALWVRSVHRYGTQAAMNYGYVEPVAAVAIAAVVLRETLTPLQLAGAVLALLGVFLASERRDPALP